MKLIRTAKIKLNISAAEILPTIKAYTKAFNFVCAIGYPTLDKNGVSLHKKTYREVREYLPSQLAISSRMKATEALTSVFTKTKHKKYGSQPKSKLCSIRYDKNSYSLFLDKKQVSLLTISGRKRYDLEIPQFYQEQFKTWKHCSADLCIIKNKVYLHIIFEKEITDISSTGKLYGIDRGINNLAVVSNNKFFGGGIIKKQVRKYQKLRNNLQAKGTKSAKRHLKRLTSKERQFRADINHQISKKIIQSIPEGSTIVLEELTGIRNKRLRKKQRTLLNNWSYFQLEQFLTYKAMAKGISVEHIDARYTSQRCSKCGFVCRSNRKQHEFCCKHCGYRLNADLNASRNICNKHLDSYKLSDRADVNQLIVGAEKLFTSHQPCAGGY
jgi:IS605 OrfB family transposase